jgi:amidohydrolase
MEPIFSKDIEDFLPQIVSWRRHFHKYPESSFNEVSTTEFLIKEIEKLGNVEITRPLATGLVAKLKGALPGPTIALRADIDALKMTELNDVEYASENDGVMHACGHDAHTAMLLGAVSVLSKNQKDLKGSFVFIFQPAEELPPGGAIELVKANVLDGVDAILGQHVSTIIDTGHVGILAGASSANADNFEITVKGRGGHASVPNLCIDPIPVAVQIVTAIQQIVTRNISPIEKAVISVTRINGGTANNIIPDFVTIAGTVRTYKKEIREKIYERMCAITTNISAAEDCVGEVNYTWGYPTTVNTPEYVDAITELGEKLYGKGTMVTMEPSMGGEDFSYYLEKVPGCFMYLGVKNAEKGCIYPGHNTKFNVDEDAFSIGATMMINGALCFQKLVEEQKKAK